MSGNAPAGYDEEVAPPASATATPKGYDEEVPPPANLSTTSTGIVVPQEMAGSPMGQTLSHLRSGLSSLITAPFEAMKPRSPDEVQYGPVGRLLKHTGEDFIGGLAAGAEARRKSAASGENWAGQTLSTLENYPIVSGFVREAEKAGPSTGMQAPSQHAINATAEILPAALTALWSRGSKLSDEATVNKLSYASKAPPEALETVLPELRKSIKQNGIDASTLGGLEDAMDATTTRLNQEFNQGIFQLRGQQITPQAIADALDAKANSLPRTAVAEKQALRAAAPAYRGAWPVEELNAERMYRDALTRNFYDKSGSAQSAAMRSNADTMVDKIVADESRNLLYDYMQKNIPGGRFRELKHIQSNLIDARDALDDHFAKLKSTQAQFKGAPLSEKLNISASAHEGGLTPRIHGIANMFRGGPMVPADAAVAKALGPPSGASQISRAAIRALPISSLTSGQRPAVIPPPPQQ